MPELPEVKNFCQILLPLVGTKVAAASSKSKTKGSIINNKHASSSSLILECPPPLPTKRFPSQNVMDSINEGGYVMKDVLRKGKVLCVILEKQQQKYNQNASSTKKKSSKTKITKSAKKEEVTNNDKDKNNENDNNNPIITGHESKLYLSLHMGMAGRISSPHHVSSLESLSEDDTYPPPHTHLILRSSNGEEAAFSDPRQFGSVLVDVGVDDDDHGDGEDQNQALMVDEEVSIPTFRDIAQDALESSKTYCAAMKLSKAKTPHSDSDTNTRQQHQQLTIVEQLSNRKKGIKGILLDQRAVISGIGNWVADEILYRSRIHPDQSYLTLTESQKLVEEMHHVLFTAVAGLNYGIGFPKEWLFHQRWRNGGGGGGGDGGGKDYNGRTISFVQSGGRSSAIVALLQKEDKARKAEKKVKGDVTLSSSNRKVKKPKRKQLDGPSSPAPDAVTSISKSSKSKVQKRPKKAKGVGLKKLQRKHEVEEPPKPEVAVSAPEEPSWKIPRTKKRKRIEEESPSPKTQPTRRSMRIMSR